MHDITEETRISAKAAISRKETTRPCKVVIDSPHFPWIGKTLLHVGVGHATHDTAAFLMKGAEAYEYDPNFANFPGNLTEQKYDFVFCAYVLNVLPPMERFQCIVDIHNALLHEGTAILAVRSTKDRGIKGKPDHDGVRTSRGTFQRPYTLDSLWDELRRYFAKPRLLWDRGGSLVICCYSK